MKRDRACPPWWRPVHDGYAIAGHGLDDVDDVPDVNRPTSPAPQTGHPGTTEDTPGHTSLDT